MRSKCSAAWRPGGGGPLHPISVKGDRLVIIVPPTDSTRSSTAGKTAWGQGYACEAARASLKLGFERFNPKEILAFTVPDNVKSRAVMTRIGMSHDAEGDFDHPNLPEGHALRRHVVYRITREEWLANSPAV